MVAGLYIFNNFLVDEFLTCPFTCGNRVSWYLLVVYTHVRLGTFIHYRENISYWFGSTDRYPSTELDLQYNNYNKGLYIYNNMWLQRRSWRYRQCDDSTSQAVNNTAHTRCKYYSKWRKVTYSNVMLIISFKDFTYIQHLAIQLSIV